MPCAVWNKRLSFCLWNLKGENLKGEILKGENLKGENLKGENLKGENLKGKTLKEIYNRGYTFHCFECIEWV